MINSDLHGRMRRYLIAKSLWETQISLSNLVRYAPCGFSG